MKMMILGKILGAVLFFFTAPSTADIISLNIRSHNRDIIRFSEFEFSQHTGNVSVAVSSVGISSVPVTSNLSQPDPSRIGFFLVPDESSYHRYDQKFKRNPNVCPFGNNSISVLFTFNNLSQASFNKTYHVPYPGEYSLYFANCNDQTLVTMDVRTELYNTDADGTTKDYLSAGQPQPSFYFKFSLIYLCFLGFWISISLKSPKSLHRIHLLIMGVLLVMTILHFLCAMGDQRALQLTGIHHGSWHTLVYIIQLMRNVLFFTVILLIGTGWCFWKPVLTRCDRFIVTIVILLQVWANVSSIAVMESGPYNKDWQSSITNFRLIDIICCLFVFFHPLFSATLLDEEKGVVTSYMATSGRRPDLFLHLFHVYVFYTRGFMCLMREMNIALEITAPLEIANLVFSIVMFYMNRPLVLEDEFLYSKGLLDKTGV